MSLDPSTAYEQDEATKRNPDANLLVNFSLESVEDPQASKEAGRPVFADVEYIHIRAPGQQFNKIMRPLRVTDLKRFKDRYKRWKDSQDDRGHPGTPLKEVPYLRKSQVDQLVFAGVHTEEQLAGLDDGALDQIGAGVRPLRQKARDRIEAGKETAHLAKFRDELVKRDGEIEALKAMLTEQAAQLEKLTRPADEAAAPAVRRARG